jgi:hypothetical protein
LRIRAKRTSTKTTYLTFYLYQGTTLIASSGQKTLTSTWTEYTYTLSEAEVANITDYTALRVRFTMASDVAAVSWCEFEIPDPAPAAGLEMGMMF